MPTSSNLISPLGLQDNEELQANPLILGTKGANLQKLTKLKINVPPGFIISSKACQSFHNNGQKLSKIINQRN